MTNAQIRETCLRKFEESNLFTDVIYPNIEKYRKGTVKLRFVDQNSNPIIGQKVIITQKTHDFKYGAHLFMLDGFSDEKDNQKYRDIFADYFNLATVPFYWQELEPEQGKPRFDVNSPKIYRRPATDLCVNYCREKGILPKLHCLVYDKFIPDWLPKDNEKEMLYLYEKRFAEIAERYHGTMYEIEVINELLCEFKWQNHSIISQRRDILEWAFALAEKYFPTDTLVINDGNYIPEIGIHDYRHPYYMLIDAALLRGVRIDKIGIQNHIHCNAVELREDALNSRKDYFDPRLLLKGFEVLSNFGKPLEITEITIPTLGNGDEAEDIQAELLKYFYTIWFSVPLMESVVYWNTVEGTAYQGENSSLAGLFHSDLTPKKSAGMLKNLFTKTWHTDLEMVTDANGEIVVRGFYGDYTANIHGNNTSFSIHKNSMCELELIL